MRPANFSLRAATCASRDTTLLASIVFASPLCSIDFKSLSNVDEWYDAVEERSEVERNPARASTVLFSTLSDERLPWSTTTGSEDRWSLLCGGTPSVGVLSSFTSIPVLEDQGGER